MNRMMKKNYRIFLAIVGCSLFMLNGCSSNSVKGITPSDASNLMKMYNVSMRYVEDGRVAKEAKVGVQKNLTQSYNASSGRHIVNFAFGGIGGLISSGVLQSGSRSAYDRNIDILDNASLLVQKPSELENDSFYKHSFGFMQKAYQAHGLDLVKVNKEGYKSIYEWYALGKIGNEQCSLEQRNCVVDIGYHNYFKTNFWQSEPAYNDFPKAFKPAYRSKKDSYHRYSYTYRQFVKSHTSDGVLGVPVNNTDILKTYHQLLTEANEFHTLNIQLYIPGYLNKGAPVVIGTDGREHNFVFNSM